MRILGEKIKKLIFAVRKNRITHENIWKEKGKAPFYPTRILYFYVFLKYKQRLHYIETSKKVFAILTIQGRILALKKEFEKIVKGEIKKFGKKITEKKKRKEKKGKILIWKNKYFVADTLYRKLSEILGKVKDTYRREVKT